MPALAFAVPMAGATVQNVWKQRANASSGLLDDSSAPFALGTVSLITPVTTGTPNGRTVAKFCRVGATGIAAAATAGIGTDGVTAAAAGGNTWTNDTGVALVTGDYAWLTTGQVTTLAADEAAAPPSRGAKAGETDEERALREAEEAEYQKAESERTSGKKSKSYT